MIRWPTGQDGEAAPFTNALLARGTSRLGDEPRRALTLLELKRAAGEPRRIGGVAEASDKCDVGFISEDRKRSLILDHVVLENAGISVWRKPTSALGFLRDETARDEYFIFLREGGQPFARRAPAALHSSQAGLPVSSQHVRLGYHRCGPA